LVGSLKWCQVGVRHPASVHPMGMERSTRIGNRPQAILHPHGNRGADLIETIRLERQAGDPQLFVPPHATASQPPRRERPQSAFAKNKPWAEPKWTHTRPASASALRVHSNAALNDMLASEPGDQPSQQGSRLPSPVPRTSSKYNASSSDTAASVAPKRRPQSAHTFAEARARARMREEHQANMDRVARKLKETQEAAAVQQEEEFQRAWDHFHSEQAGHVADMERFIRLKDAEQARRANAHCKHWNEEVFDKIQAQVDVALRKREAKGTYNTRWRHAQDDYLKALKKKEAGIFRDIIIQDEYDPLEIAAMNIKYKSKRISANDPLKTELTLHAREAEMVPGSAANLAAETQVERAGVGRGQLPVTEWSRLDATPFGHFNKVMSREESGLHKDPPYSTTGLRVLGDHYTRH